MTLGFRVEIECETDAFDDETHGIGTLTGEVVRLLRETADQLEEMPIARTLNDVNGRPVGMYTWTSS